MPQRIWEISITSFDKKNALSKTHVRLDSHVGHLVGEYSNHDQKITL